MESALILYHSRTGTTAVYGQEIAAMLGERGVKVKAVPMYNADKEHMDEFDTLFLGCWTSGLFFFRQRPEKVWIEYLNKMNGLVDKEIVLFTTYKILTGSMFREMQKHLPDGASVSRISLKSRNGKLSLSDRQLLDQLINK